MKETLRGIRECVLDARERWLAGREEVRGLHDAGESPFAVVRALSDLVDEILLCQYRSVCGAISDDLDHRIAVVLHGGNGRREVAPFSDVDMTVLFQGSLTEDIAEFSRQFSQDVTDIGLKIGYSLRTPRDACGMSLKDPELFTSLTESRFLAGNEQLFDTFLRRFKRLATRRTANVIRGIIAAREKERQRFGETVYLLRPNVKKSRGGLRDLHLIRWLGFVRYGEKELEALQDRGAFTKPEVVQLRASQEFLFQVRNELHFHAGRSNDGLGRNEQVRIAEKFGYKGNEAVLPVEAFMRHYFRCTSRIRYNCDHFTARCENRRTIASSFISPLVVKRLDEHFEIGNTTIGVALDSLPQVRGDLSQVLRLLQLCGLHGKQIEHETWSAIRETMLGMPSIKVDSASAERFMALLSHTAGLDQLLRRLHDMQVLRILIPAFEHARGLLQFNEYHMFTVDEHSLRAVQAATQLEQENSVAGKTYRRIRRKNILHLALLLHDLGKGYPEDHCEVGRRIAEQTGKRLGLSRDDTEDIKFLVHNHLVMSHVAFHRDINDESLVAEFASNVGSVELLAMLFVLTCADISAVGPGVLNDWKKGLLTDLFIRARKVLTGEWEGPENRQRFERLLAEIGRAGGDSESEEWLRETAVNLPNNYFDTHTAEQIADQLLATRELSGDAVQCWVQRVPGTDLVELCIGKRERRRSGIFYKLTGMLASMGLRVLTADIKPLGNSLLWYWFQFKDDQFETPPEGRLVEIRRRATAVASGADERPPEFSSTWQKRESRAVKLSRPKIEVRVNNDTVDTATIIDVFAYNKVGLLYRISQKIYELGLDVTYARISTYAHQVIDVFYVTDDSGNKIRNEGRIRVIAGELLEAVQQFLADTPHETDSESDQRGQ